jgi:hypothetical protein
MDKELLKIIKIHNVKVDVIWSEYLPQIALSAELDIEVKGKQFTVPINWEYGFGINGNPFLENENIVDEEIKELEDIIDKFLDDNKEQVTQALEKSMNGELVKVEEIVFNQEL